MLLDIVTKITGISITTKIDTKYSGGNEQISSGVEDRKIIAAANNRK